MKYLLIVLLVLPIACMAQDHTRQYVATTGDTITKSTRLRVLNVPAYTYVYPFTMLSGEMHQNAAKRYVTTHMPGRTYVVARLTRIMTEARRYKAIVVLQINDPAIQRGKVVEYFVDIEPALKFGEVEVIKD